MTRFGAYITSDDVSVPFLIASGAPTTGTHVVGESYVAEDGLLWICTVAGTPGTWVDAGTTDLGFAEKADIQQFTGTTVTDISGLSLSTTSRGRPYYVYLDIPQIKNNAAVAINVALLLTLSDNTILRQSTVNMASGITVRDNLLIRYRFNDAAGTARSLKGRMNSNSASGDFSIVEGSNATVSATLSATEV